LRIKGNDTSSPQSQQENTGQIQDEPITVSSVMGPMQSTHFNQVKAMRYDFVRRKLELMPHDFIRRYRACLNDLVLAELVCARLEGSSSSIPAPG